MEDRTIDPERQSHPLPLIGFQGNDIPDDSMLQACVHCGMCLAACPTYRITGLEVVSPRGRIQLIKAVNEGKIGLESEVFQEQMSECLNCRACEPACPSGVEYGRLVEASRAQIEQAREQRPLPPPPHPEMRPSSLVPRPWWQRLVRGVVFEHLFQNMALFRAFSRIMAFYQQSGMQWLVRRSGVLTLMGLDEIETLLPSISRRFVAPQGQIYRAEGTAHSTVALLTGCIMSTAFAHVHEATIRVLQKNCCDVLLPPAQACCGALHSHSGDLDGARKLARYTITAFEGLGIDAIITNAAGCGSMLKEYPHLLHDDPEWQPRAVAFARKVQDIHEFLAHIEFNREDLRPLLICVTYQEPCHLAHAQRLTGEPRMLLSAIPGLELREMQESALCCGSAGIYNILQPEMAETLGSRKITHALATGSDVIATANPGCAIQLAGQLRRHGSNVQVRYIVELLDESYRQTTSVSGRGGVDGTDTQ